MTSLNAALVQILYVFGRCGLDAQNSLAQSTSAAFPLRGYLFGKEQMNFASTVTEIGGPDPPKYVGGYLARRSSHKYSVGNPLARSRCGPLAHFTSPLSKGSYVLIGTFSTLLIFILYPGIYMKTSSFTSPHRLRSEDIPRLRCLGPLSRAEGKHVRGQ